MNNKNLALTYLDNKLEVAKFVKYIISDLLNGVSQSNMFVYNGVIYSVLIKDC